jgi:ssDNA-binding Zn-finger/Zn-ribbon topoisomerase 1
MVSNYYKCEYCRQDKAFGKCPNCGASESREEKPKYAVQNTACGSGVMIFPIQCSGRYDTERT